MAPAPRRRRGAPSSSSLGRRADRQPGQGNYAAANAALDAFAAWRAARGRPTLTLRFGRGTSAA
ncbi:MAG: KR domain-containing protein [Myxococcales bacterium]|nr:KR domain-containing protein [Myxococcales bacterium]